MAGCLYLQRSSCSKAHGKLLDVLVWVGRLGGFEASGELRTEIGSNSKSRF